LCCRSGSGEDERLDLDLFRSEASETEREILEDMANSETCVGGYHILGPTPDALSKDKFDGQSISIGRREFLQSESTLESREEKPPVLAM
jgi:hypothetical protein